MSSGGLSGIEVAVRVERGQMNGRPGSSGRSVFAIVRSNAFTRFNLILVGLFVATLAMGSTKDTLFIWVVVLNLMVGVAQ